MLPDCVENGPPSWVPCIPAAARVAAQAPWREDRGSTAVWRSLQDGFDPRNQSDYSRRAVRSALSCEDHHGVTLLQVRECYCRNTAQRLLKISSSASAGRAPPSPEAPASDPAGFGACAAAPVAPPDALPA